GLHQRDEGDGNEEQLTLGSGRRHRHPGLVVARGAGERQNRLRQRQGQRQDEGEMAEFGDHCVVPSCQRPDFFRASTTSFGMYFSSCLASTSAATKVLSVPSAPCATTPWPSRKRSGRMPL